MPASLILHLNPRTLRQQTGDRTFQRGEDYFNKGRVVSLAEYEGTVTAKVLGTEEYQVKLWLRHGNLDYSCTCPVGGEGDFCKHCVAVGLAWFAQQQGTVGQKAQQPRTHLDDVRDYLLKLDKPKLVSLFMEQVINDDHLREKLLMRAAA